MAQFRKDTRKYLSDGKTIFEVTMLSDKLGNVIHAPGNPSGAAIDAFGRARESQPFTLFDSFHRYKENDKFCTSNNAGGTYSFIANTASIDCTVNSTSGVYVYRETKKVFSYQPGKSLQILKTFVMNPAKTNLRQRVGYFSTTNGFFLERNGSTVQFVKRSSINGSVVDTAITQANWNTDKLDGTGLSEITLNLDDPQILFIDMEWLGVGSVRMGFVINGQQICCHVFNHANDDSSPKGAYIQTAVLPIRMEIENTGATTGSSTLKEICSTVISEGGYTLTGKSYTLGQDPVSTNQFALATAGTYYPVIALRLNPAFPDAVVIPTDIACMPINAANYRYKIVSDATLTGAVWANVASNSSVQYNTNTSAVLSGGTDLFSSYVATTVQRTGTINLSREDFFKYQLERNTLANTQSIFVLAVTSGTATCNVCGSVSWEEVT